MKTPARLAFSFTIIVLFLGGGYLLSRTADTSIPVVPSPTYENETYGYSFSYPRDYTVKEYTGEYVSVGIEEGESFTSVADISLHESVEEGVYANFDAFLLERGRTLCAADGPDQSISCTEVTKSTPFTSSAGVGGYEVYFTLEESTYSTGEVKTSTFGPVYAFDASAKTPDAEFSALLIHQPLPAFLEGEGHTAVTQIADSFSW